MALSTQSGDRQETAIASREWLLSCEGFRVEGPEGFVGYVARVRYEHSARWDRPSALVVRGRTGVVNVPIARVDTVSTSEARIVLAA